MERLIIPRLINKKKDQKRGNVIKIIPNMYRDCFSMIFFNQNNILREFYFANEGKNSI